MQDYYAFVKKVIMHVRELNYSVWFQSEQPESMDRNLEPEFPFNIGTID